MKTLNLLFSRPAKTGFIMKTKLRFLFIALALIAGIHQAAAQERYFRIVGPAATKIIAFRTDGTLVWTNARTGTNYIVQTVASLPGGTDWVDYVQLPVTNSVNTNLIFDFAPPAGMALIPAGLFTMGDVADTNVNGDASPTNTMVSACYMDVNLVSYNLWKSVHSYATNHGYNFDDAGSGQAGNYPAQTVDWYDAVKWCNARSKQAGLTPVYYTDTNFTQVYTNGDVDLSAANVNWAANGYRLPTEAEWEKAARGGLIGQRFPWGGTISWSQANYYGDPGGLFYDDSTADDYDPAFSDGDSGDYPYASPVGYFAPNGYGLYDMAGNVYEWCWDWYNTPYAGGTDPRGPASSPEGDRVLRGGSWQFNASYSRCANRYAHLPHADYDYYGFRCVMGL